MSAQGGALAWHADIEMSARDRDTFLSGRWVARLATNGADGYPHVVPSYYYWDGAALYLSLTRNRVAGRNLLRDPRCSVVIDVDERPVRGMASNHAMAVTAFGDAVLHSVDDGDVVHVGAGPWAGDHTAGELLSRMLDRYGLWVRDGVVGGSHDEVLATLAAAAPEDRSSTDNQHRLVVKVVPRRVRSWDFSKAPMLPPGTGARGPA